jgi:hypothetical protein
MSTERTINNDPLEKKSDDAENASDNNPKKPFDLDEALRDENVEAAKKDSEAEQQRKEAMTERD